MRGWHFVPDSRLPSANAILPTLTILLAQLIELIPGTYLSGIMPWMTFSIIFYWGLYRSEYLPLWLCFSLGILADILTGAVLGLYGLMYVAIREVAKGQKRYLAMRNFPMMWIAFSSLIGGLVMIQTFILTSVGYIYDPFVLAKYVQTVFAFPIVYYVIARVHHHLVYEGWI